MSVEGAIGSASILVCSGINRPDVFNWETGGSGAAAMKVSTLVVDFMVPEVDVAIGADSGETVEDAIVVGVVIL